MSIRERIRALIDLVPAAYAVAEIGADHGILSALLLQENRCARMIVTDISAASLDKAKRLIARRELGTRVEFRVADGLAALDAPVDAIVVAGMGAASIQRILERGKDQIGNAALVLQPNVDPMRLRRYLMEAGFIVDAERLILDSGRYYVAMRAERGSVNYSPAELLIGPCLLREQPKHYAEYMAWRRDCLMKSRSDTARRELKIVTEAMEGYT